MFETPGHGWPIFVLWAAWAFQPRTLPMLFKRPTSSAPLMPVIMPSQLTPNASPPQAWIDDMASYIKGVDSNHLVMVGSFGTFGASTPSLVAQNPTDMVVLTDQDTRLFPVAQVCQGEDSSAIAALPHIDMADM